jgi:RNA polymerase sigma-70 factor (ECF subfamily)
MHFLGRQDAEAEDVVQETYLTAHQKLPGFEFRSGLYLWLNHICVNFCLKRLERRFKTLATQEEELEKLSQNPALERARLREQEEESQSAAGRVARAIEAMGPECQKALRLRHLKGLSYAGVGQALKIPLGTVMSRLARCREQLKARLKEQGVER